MTLVYRLFSRTYMTLGCCWLIILAAAICLEARAQTNDGPAAATEIQQHTDQLRRTIQNFVSFRPVIGVKDNPGFGTISDMAFTYWGRWIFMGFRTFPLVSAQSDDGDVVSVGLSAEVGYNHQWFAVGLGAGLGATSGDMITMLGRSPLDFWNATTADPPPFDERVDWKDRTRIAFSPSLFVRIGRLDRIHALVFNRLYHYSGLSNGTAPAGDRDGASVYHDGMIYGGTGIVGTIPITSSLDLFIDAGIGRLSYVFATAGLMYWIRGDDQGTGAFGVGAAAGFGATGGDFQNADGNSQLMHTMGPVFGLRLEYRKIVSSVACHIGSVAHARTACVEYLHLVEAVGDAVGIAVPPSVASLKAAVAMVL